MGILKSIFGGGQKEKITFKERIDMYDMIIANWLAKDSIIEPDHPLDSSKISIGFSNIASATQITKYFMITNFPDYLSTRLMDQIRMACIDSGVKVNFYIYGAPYKIRWDSAEMKNKMNIWKDYTDKAPDDPNVFEYRQKRDSALAKQRIINSTRYLNDAELNQKRTTMKVSFVVAISGRRDDESLLNLSRSIQAFKSLCNIAEIKYREIQVNLMDWIQTLEPLSMRNIKETTSRISRKAMTDDILAHFNSYKQGRVGTTGVPLGIDIVSKVPALWKFKEDPDAPENWLISATTGGGKSYFVKTLLTYLLADGFVVTVLDYEGDEYTNLANYIKTSNPDDVRVISMGKGSAVYFDPMEIPELTGDMKVDADLKESAINYTLSTFRIITCGIEEELTQYEQRIISSAIKRVYDRAGVTDDMQTWCKSKGLRIHMVYDEIKKMVDSQELVDESLDNIRHKSAFKIADAASVYFEEGEAKAGTFKHPMSANELYNARFIVFSFGMNGATSSQIDPAVLALKQLSVANVSIQVSNYCKYVRHCFNVKVWEEYQRWGEAKGSAEIISNAMTGGRKRGDVNFIITNDLQNILDDTNEISKRIYQNIQGYAIGKITDQRIRAEFCDSKEEPDLEPILALIDKASGADGSKSKRKASGIGNRYKNAFCVILPNGKKTVVKAMLPSVVVKSDLFRTGVDIDAQQTKEPTTFEEEN